MHIGDKRAEQLIKLRPFYSLNDLTRISGIGDGRLSDIKKQGIACVN
jgi:competence protein ComEC